jgi:hypothetical protein
MNIELELHNLKMKVLTDYVLGDEKRKELADEISKIEKGVAMNYMYCCETLPSREAMNSQLKTLVADNFEDYENAKEYEFGFRAACRFIIRHLKQK